ncbi:unnamed protein product [Vitrella brassicaformis CCMP3155]|uniref:Uncharacterized protein n=1 Tax=Vitrella brassicaformis (strain CCMP3155) TaxID=1169540 RepID=A0A0G4G7S8_VITBC|nr:unnamed protein product [Vitrella brassicaformis CCMP3155]|eukprot:CEM24713.1 unnamed protein product [Vitrella brassicaformis CCMP3155]
MMMKIVHPRHQTRDARVQALKEIIETADPNERLETIKAYLKERTRKRRWQARGQQLQYGMFDFLRVFAVPLGLK